MLWLHFGVNCSYKCLHVESLPAAIWDICVHVFDKNVAMWGSDADGTALLHTVPNYTSLADWAIDFLNCFYEVFMNWI